MVDTYEDLVGAAYFHNAALVVCVASNIGRWFLLTMRFTEERTGLGRMGKFSGLYRRNLSINRASPSALFKAL